MKEMKESIRQKEMDVKKKRADNCSHSQWNLCRMKKKLDGFTNIFIINVILLTQTMETSKKKRELYGQSIKKIAFKV